MAGRPIQMGVPSTKMSASRICWRTPGHSSPSPSSEVTPGRMLRSATRTVPLDETPWDSSAERTSPMILSVLETSVEDLSEQFRAKALRLFITCGLSFWLGQVVSTACNSFSDALGLHHDSGHNLRDDAFIMPTSHLRDDQAQEDRHQYNGPEPKEVHFEANHAEEDGQGKKHHLVGQPT